MTRCTMISTTALQPAVASLDQQPADRVAIASSRELFVDRYLIESMRGDNAGLWMATPVDAGSALALDLRDCRAWYYRGLPKSGQDGNNAEVTCCAESTDGTRWTRSQLDLSPHPDAPRNNIIQGR